MNIGRNSAGTVELDLERLIKTRMLIQASSGAGKSYALRTIAERAGVQTIALDWDGEMTTLRERLDMVLVGPSGDIPADPRSAGLLARRLMEHRASAVIDFSEMQLDDRFLYVEKFLQALVGLPRELWHPALILIDEAQKFCPEGGRSDCANAVISLLTLGRKRGYCAVLATQRLSELNKNAAAECLNRLIGRTELDVDQERAGKRLGMNTRTRTVLGDLHDGEFFGYGPAFGSHEVIRFRGDLPETKPPLDGHEIRPPAPSDAIRRILLKLTDLPVEAAKQATTIEEMRDEIAKLKTQLGAKPRPAGVDQAALDEAVRARVADALDEERCKSAAHLQRIREALAGVLAMVDESGATRPPASENDRAQNFLSQPARNGLGTIGEAQRRAIDKLPLGERAVLEAILDRRPRPTSRDYISIVTKYKKSSRNKYLDLLKRRGLIVRAGDDFAPSPELFG